VAVRRDSAMYAHMYVLLAALHSASNVAHLRSTLKCRHHRLVLVLVLAMRTHDVMTRPHTLLLPTAHMHLGAVPSATKHHGKQADHGGPQDRRRCETAARSDAGDLSFAILDHGQ